MQILEKIYSFIKMLGENISFDYVIIIASAFASVIAAIFAYKSYSASKKPKLILETPENHSLVIRNVGTDTANKIQETTGMFRNTPDELRPFDGPIDYIRVKSPGISEQIDFHDKKRISPSSSCIIRFEYENSDEKKFYSEITIKRDKNESPPWYHKPEQIRWGKRRRFFLFLKKKKL